MTFGLTFLCSWFIDKTHCPQPRLEMNRLCGNPSQDPPAHEHGPLTC